MPIYARQSSTWYLATAPRVYARQSGIWYQASFIYARQSSYWYGTDYVGLPNSPQYAGGWSTIVTSAADNFSTVTLNYWGPSGGPSPTGYVHRMYNSSGVLLQKIGPGDAGYAAGGVTFNVTKDTAYIFRVYSVNAAGESIGYLEARYAIGHPQVTHQADVNGWQAEYDYGVDVTYASSQLPDHLSGYAVDWKNNSNPPWYATNWMGVARAANWMMDGLRLYPVVGAHPENTRLVGVRIWPSYGVQLFIGLWNAYNPGGWHGSDYTPNESGLWVDGTAYNTLGTHPYVNHGVFNGGNEYHYRPLENGMDIRAGHMICDVVVWDLSLIGAAYYGGLLEVIFRMSNYGKVGEVTVVDVNQQNNYGW